MPQLAQGWTVWMNLRLKSLVPIDPAEEVSAVAACCSACAVVAWGAFFKLGSLVATPLPPEEPPLSSLQEIVNSPARSNTTKILNRFTGTLHFLGFL